MASPCSHRPDSRATLDVAGVRYAYYALDKVAARFGDISRLPYSLKVLLENLVRNEDGLAVTGADIQAVVDWQKEARSLAEIQYRPGRVVMQDFSGVACLVDLAAMRDIVHGAGGDAGRINPQVPVHLVIDHSVAVDVAGRADAARENARLEFERNRERYEFFRWSAAAFDNLKVVPPGTGIIHQVNVEHIARVVWTGTDGDGTLIAYPDTCIGTDSHTTMVNGLGVLGWGVGGIEAEAAMLGQPVSILVPEVVGCRLKGRLREGVTATDLVLAVTQMLRARGVVGRFVEFCGPGLDDLAVADRATIANMAPEYGATCGFFPVDNATLNYLRLTGRDHDATLAEAYAKAQGLWRDADTPEPLFTDLVELDMDAIEPSVAGPKRPQDRVALSSVASGFAGDLAGLLLKGGDAAARVPVQGRDFSLGHGDIIIAAITSCTNTSNPLSMIAAGLVARKARILGLKVKPWVKTSLAPGSQVVSDYLARAGLQRDLDALGFNTVGYGCTTCIGNSGPIDPAVADAIEAGGLVAGTVLSGNRNFEGRISPHARANYLASPPLVVAYALFGTVARDITSEPLGRDAEGRALFLRDIWPSAAETAEIAAAAIRPEMFSRRYADVYAGDARWQDLPVEPSKVFGWDPASTNIAAPSYVRLPDGTSGGAGDIEGARPLAILGDFITTDHISPAGAIRADAPAACWLMERGVRPADFNSYGARRGSHEVMMRGTFAHPRLRNEMVPDTEGGVTLYEGEVMSIFDAAMRHKAEGTPLIVIAGKEYGVGSARDWAAKGTSLLGIRAVIAESFERIHRSNLVGMGVLPLQFVNGMTRETLGLSASDRFAIMGIAALRPGEITMVQVTREDGSAIDFPARCRLETSIECAYLASGGILGHVLRRIAA